MRVVLTRAVEQQNSWREGLQAAGHEVQTLALLEIAALEIAQPECLSRVDALMFVSRNAVQTFFVQKWAIAVVNTTNFATSNIAFTNSMRYWATGPGTVAALLSAGVRSEQIDSPAASEAMDSESLWKHVKTQIQPGAKVLIVRGRDVFAADQAQIDGSRGWLTSQIEAAGGIAHRVVVYERRSPSFSREQCTQMQTWLHDNSLWLLTSSQALLRLPRQLDVSHARCLCTHERIAQAARERGFAVVYTSRPVIAEVLASIKSINV